MHQNNSQLYSQKEIKTLLLRLNAYDLTSNFWIYFASKVSSHKSWKTAQILKCNNVPLTVQQFKHNALSLEFPGAVFCLNLLEAPSFLESICFFFLSFLNHMVFDKFIQFKSYVKSASHYYYCFNVFTDR